IIITDDRARIIKANLAYEKILGYSAHEIIGKHARYLRSSKHNSAFYHSLWQQVYEKGSWQGEVWIRHKKGHVVPIWLSISTQQNASGKKNYYIGVMYDISEQKHYNERINFLAHYDALTLLPNRTLFTDRLQQSITYAKRNKFKFALLFIDLDDFKHVNDSRGHLIGDELLRKVATKLSSIMRATDTVFRLGGDEFTILTETENDINEDKVSYIATKVLDTISKPIDLSGEKVHISASIGITLYPDDGDDIESLLKHADMAMYRSKESGRNNFLFYTQEMSKRVQERILLHTDLRQALQDHRLQFYYQPIIDIQTKSYVGAEALLRWKHADLGWVPPQKFISIAEDSDLILELGEWALLQACQQLKLWLNAGINPGVLSVNVSGKQLIRGDFLKITKDILEKTNCPPEKIILEMTESFIMKESEGAIITLNKLRELGLGVAIDDFGTGYSSLSYLKRLPVTNLKVDKSFVQDLPGDANVVEITRAIFSMGSALGLNIVFEGVETRQQHDFLLAEKCKFVQGFHYAKPMSSELFSKYLQDAEYLLDLTD
ncbi:MAG: EAL domain-containing protein, partial [Nitrosomonas sp.]|nr:EAL domain-containing protein [Nitrosomonas sp.]